MRQIIKLQLILGFFLIGLASSAQNGDRFPRLRERIAQAKLREIGTSLKLDQRTFDRFRPIYLNYEREITAVDFRKIGKLMRVEADSLSPEEANRLIVDQLKAAKSMVEIREKYYYEFKKVLQPQQIIKLYQTEAEIRKKVMQEVRKRMINR